MLTPQEKLIARKRYAEMTLSQNTSVAELRDENDHRGIEFIHRAQKRYTFVCLNNVKTAWN